MTVNYNFGVERVDSDGEITVFIAQGTAIDGAQIPSRTSNVSRIYIRYHGADQ